MAKTLEFTTKSPRQIKQGDTETTFTFICKNDGSVVDLTKATNITAKIGNASGYLRSQSIAINSLATLNQGWLNLQPMPDLISGLPAGDYQLEIWVVDQAGTSIYPSDAPLGFTITNNIENESGASITTIAFDDFVKEMHKAASTIAKGDPGEGLDIKGQVTSVSALPATVNEGDGYLVNEELYVYTSGAWKDCGTIQGPQGIQGKTGTGISSTTIQYQISNSATTAPTGTWSNDIVATTTANPYLWMKATLNYTDNTTKDFYLISQKGDKGDKGDTGTVDNTGLTTAPAFQALQTQVDNKVTDNKDGTEQLNGVQVQPFNKLSDTIGGRNMATSLGDVLIQALPASSSWSNFIVGKITPEFLKVINQGTTQPITISFEINTPDDPTKTNLFDRVRLNGGAWGNDYVIGTNYFNVSGFKWVEMGNNVWKGTYALQFDQGSVAVDSNNLEIGIMQLTNNKAPHDFTVLRNSLCLYWGTQAIDWTPAPEEILTQADYAKIKAAIVALGGSLS